MRFNQGATAKRGRSIGWVRWSGWVVAILCLGFATLIGLDVSLAAQNRQPRNMTSTPEGRDTGLAGLIARIEKDLPGLHARLMQAEAREIATEALPRWYAPDLRLELGGGIADNGEETRAGPLARIVGVWTFWDGGRRAGRHQLAETSARIARVQADLYRYDLRLSLARSYYRLAEIEQLKRINADESRRLRRLKNLLYPRIRIGSIGVSEITGLDLQRSELQDRNRALTNEARHIHDTLNIMTGRMHPNEAADRKPTNAKTGTNTKAEAVNAKAKVQAQAKSAIVVSPLFTLPLPQNISVVPNLATRPRVRLARLRAGMSKASLELARRELYWPSIGLEVYGGYQPVQAAISPTRPEAGAQFAIRLPLFGSASRSSALKSERLKNTAADQSAEQVKRETYARLLELKHTLADSLERVALQQRLARRARRNLQTAFHEFAGGLKAPADMREAIQLYSKFERNQVALRRRALLSRFELDLPASLASTTSFKKIGEENEEKQK